MKSRLCILCLLLFSTAAFAHDLYLVSGVPGAQAQVCARIGEEFPGSTNAVTADRLTSFQLHPTAGAPVPLKGTVTDKQFCAPLNSSGSAVVEMTVQPRFIRLEPKIFGQYITGEGFKHVLSLRRERGLEDKDGRELYSRYAKLLIGPQGQNASKPLAHALEIVPDVDPAALKVGEPLSATVLFKGMPPVDVQVAAVYSGAKLKGHEFPIVTRTDSRGKALLKLDRPGLWYARLIYMEPAQNDPEIDWRSYFATLTFQIPGTGTANRQSKDGRP